MCHWVTKTLTRVIHGAGHELAVASGGQESDAEDVALVVGINDERYLRAVAGVPPHAQRPVIGAGRQAAAVLAPRQPVDTPGAVA